jgi:hypothetical protein
MGRAGWAGLVVQLGHGTVGPGGFSFYFVLAFLFSLFFLFILIFFFIIS